MLQNGDASGPGSVDELKEQESKRRILMKSEGANDDMYGDIDMEEDGLLLAEGMMASRKPIATMINLNGQCEADRRKRLGHEKWKKAVIKAIDKWNPDLVIGGSNAVAQEDWEAIYEHQEKKSKRFMHVGKPLGDKQAFKGTIKCKASGKRVTFDTNSQKIDEGMNRRKVGDIPGCAKKQVEREKIETAERDKEEIMTLTANGDMWVDVRGGWLNKEMVIEARREEMGYVKRRHVYDRVPWSQAKERTGKNPIKLRWVDTNKGTDKEPLYRSRLVAMEFKRDSRLDLYAPTPPLEAMKLILSNAASRSEGESQRVIMAVDIKRAYFYAKSRRETYIELPAEDYEAGDGEKCGVFSLSLYGTRDAALNWECEIRGSLEDMGFK